MSQTFLIIDHNTDSRNLLARTLVRQFPGSAFHECGDGERSLSLAHCLRPSVIVVHRTAEYEGIALVSLFRRMDPAVPIVMVSGRDQREAALAAGANVFLDYDAWLRIGEAVKEAVNSGTGSSTPPWQVGDALGEALAG